MGLCATLAVVALEVAGAPLGWLNHPIQDWWSRTPFLSLDGSGAWAGAAEPLGAREVAVVAIDEGAVERVGRWPWNRVLLARLIDELRLAGVKTIALDVLLETPQRGHWRADARSGEPLEFVLDDAALAAAMREHGNVVLAVNFSSETKKGAADPALEERDAALRAVSAAGERSAVALPTPVPGRDEAHPQPPVESLAEEAARLADVNITGRHDPDAVLREIPIWSSFEGRLWPTLGAAAALAHRDAAMAHVEVGAGGGVVAGDLRLIGRPAEANRHLVTYPRPMTHWQEALREGSIVSAGWVLEAALAAASAREATREADRMVRSAAAEPFNLVEPDEAYAQAVATLLKEDVTSEAFAGALQGARPMWDRLSADAADYLTLFEGVEPADEQERLFQQGLAAFSQGLPALASQIEAAPGLILERRAAIRQRLAGTLAFVGWLETGAAVDVVATPVHPKTPGVVVHAVVAQSMLTGHQRRDPPWWLDPAVALAAGVVGTLLAARLSVMVSPWLLVVFGGGLAGAEGILWNDALLAAAPAPPLLAAGLSWLSVTLFRLLVEQRARRRTEDRFKRYVSPEVVDILVANPSLSSMAPEQRRLTILFADLEDFTALAERLGPQRTGRLLNDCLSRYTQVLLAHGATLDKYLGDGLMAFWGAPVETPDHATLAVEAALAMQRAQEDMNLAGALRGGAAGADSLRLRIGIATGDVMVGDFGAPPVRSGYTVIGDAVNLASRLEGANRPTGAAILVDSATADAVREAFLLRPVGRVRLRGRRQPEPLYEPLCRLAEADAASRARAAAAERLAEAYARGDFAAARSAAAALEGDPRDRPLAALYRAEIDRWAAAQDGGTGSPSAAHSEVDTDGPPAEFHATLFLTDAQPFGNAHPKEPTSS